MTFKQLFRNIWEKIVIHKYVSTGLAWGDAESYWFMGEPVGYESLCNRMNFWESKYKKLGYIPIERERWVEAGGYGREYESQLRVTKNN